MLVLYIVCPASLAFLSWLTLLLARGRYIYVYCFGLNGLF
jgi:hypothetical protein